MLLGTKVPWGVSSEEGGAARGPSTPRCTSPWRRSWLFLLDFLCWSWSCFLLVTMFVLGYSSLGLALVWSFSPSTRVGILFGSLSLFLFGVLAGYVFFFFFSLSLSGAGEPQTPSGFGFPLVTLLRAHGLRLDPFFLFRSYIKVQVPHLFFLSCRRSRGLWSVFCSRGGVSVRPVFWLVLVACLLSSCTLASCLVFRETATPGMAPFPLQIGSSRVTRLLLGVDPGTVRSAAGRGCGRHCDPANS